MDSFVNLNPLAAAATQANMHDHHNSISLANVCEVQKFQLEVRDALEQLNIATTRMTNNVLTVQTIDQIIGTISDQLQAQQLQVHQKIRE
uniref:Uncharacterized protein n=1 Tax=Romanomermis culicivorax TaxID=13658 RepID=A0A915IE99_ROMCU